MQETVAGTGGRSPEINQTNGGLVLSLEMPSIGPLAPRPALIYNSRAADQTIQYGYGWADLFNPSVTEISSEVAMLIDGQGASYAYFDKDSTGKYLAPEGVSSALKENAGGGWTETRVDGFQIVYDTSGLMSRMQSPAGGRWTVTRTGELLSAIIDPALRRTTYTYDGSSKLRTIRDCAGRRMTFTVDGSGNLTKITQPDGARLTLVYSASHCFTQSHNP
jgi:YD repeat-containing protein